MSIHCVCMFACMYMPLLDEAPLWGAVRVRVRVRVSIGRNWAESSPVDGLTD